MSFFTQVLIYSSTPLNVIGELRGTQGYSIRRYLLGMIAACFICIFQLGNAQPHWWKCTAKTKLQDAQKSKLQPRLRDLRLAHSLPMTCFGNVLVHHQSHLGLRLAKREVHRSANLSLSGLRWHYTSTLLPNFHPNKWKQRNNFVEAKLAGFLMFCQFYPLHLLEFALAVFATINNHVQLDIDIAHPSNESHHWTWH